MHRREVELIAKVLRERRLAYVGVGPMSEENKVGCQAVEFVAVEMCRALKAENHGFRDDLFIKAVGMPS